MKKIKKTKRTQKQNIKNATKEKQKNSSCSSKKKEGYKDKNLIRNTPFKLHNIHERNGVLRTPSNIQDGDFCKTSQRLLVVNCFRNKLHLRSLTWFQGHIIKQ